MLITFTIKYKTLLSRYCVPIIQVITVLSCTYVGIKQGLEISLEITNSKFLLDDITLAKLSFLEHLNISKGLLRNIVPRI